MGPGDAQIDPEVAFGLLYHKLETSPPPPFGIMKSVDVTAGEWAVQIVASKGVGLIYLKYDRRSPST